MAAVQSTNQQRSSYGPPCKATEKAGAQDAWDACSTVMEVHGYELRGSDTGSRNCRQITGGTNYSLHAYFIACTILLWNLHKRIAGGLACDFNWQCLSGDTLITTSEGPHRIEDLAGTTTRVLTRDPVSGGAAKWVDAPVRQFGEQQTFSIDVSRRGIARTVRATAEHRWFIRRRENRDQSKTKQRVVEVTTADLRSGDAIVGCLPPPQAFRTLLSSVGVAAGNVYGDGSRGKNRDSHVDLYGDSMELIRFYPEPNVYSVKSAGGQPGMRVANLPGAWKRLPDVDESASYLLGWLAGYFAADGSVSKSGAATITSNNLGSLEAFSIIAAKVGVACGPISSRKNEAFGGVFERFAMSLVPSTVPDHFFVREQHRRRFAPVPRKTDRYDFTVESVEPFGVEPVYCATVNETGTFALDGWMLTGNSNPYGPRLVTDMPREMVDAILAIRTKSGARVFGWGGYYAGNKDAMHFELVCMPADLATGIDWSTVQGPPIAHSTTTQPPKDDEMSADGEIKLLKAAQDAEQTRIVNGMYDFGRPGGDLNGVGLDRNAAGGYNVVQEWWVDGKHHVVTIVTDVDPWTFRGPWPKVVNPDLTRIDFQVQKAKNLDRLWVTWDPAGPEPTAIQLPHGYHAVKLPASDTDT